jgi:hypothetical protein
MKEFAKQNNIYRVYEIIRKTFNSKEFELLYFFGLTQKSNKKGQVLPNELENYLHQNGKF